MSTPLFSSIHGMATLTPFGLKVFEALEDLFLDWASRSGAHRVRYPALLPVEDLGRLNYFQNFPQLVMCACTLDGAAQQRHSERHDHVASVPPADLRNAEYCLPPAACYNVYLSLRGSALERAQYFTTVANCFRSEDHFRGLERLRSFTMREIVCVGPAELVKAHLRTYRQLIADFVSHLQLPALFEKASDPFFDKKSAGARAARIFPTKEELVYDGRLAIGSINYHRRFFGKRCDITVGASTASTGCVAFGIERWIYALSDHLGDDPERICRAIATAQASLGPTRGSLRIAALAS